MNGVRQGQGEFKSATAHYVGEWVSDNAHGKGKLVVGSTSYSGTFDDGQFVAGEYASADGAVYTAQQFVNFHFIDGRGTVRYADGSVFSGTFKVGVREGEGRHEFPDGSVLQGLWKHDLPNGPMTWQGGAGQWLKSYAGPYVDGRPHAKQAEASFSDGSRFVGSFKGGLADRGELTLADGSVLVGKFRSGQWLTGKSTYTLTEADELTYRALNLPLGDVAVAGQGAHARPRATVAGVVGDAEQDELGGAFRAGVVQHDRHSLNTHERPSSVTES